MVSRDMNRRGDFRFNAALAAPTILFCVRYVVNMGVCSIPPPPVAYVSPIKEGGRFVELLPSAFDAYGAALNICLFVFRKKGKGAGPVRTAL